MGLSFKRNILFEVSWEACNQVGGIYTVLRSKTPSMIDKFGYDNYYLIGPYIKEQAISEFNPINELPAEISESITEMKENGYDVYYGTWLISGRPNILLFDLDKVADQINEIKYYIWIHYGISISGNDKLLNEVISFGFLVTEFIRSITKKYISTGKVLCHFHEWMSCIPILNIKRENLQAKTVFTTHATLIGRYLAMTDDNFYNNISNYNIEEEAKKFNILPAVKIEQLAVSKVDIFTTVSNITAKECEQFFNRKPDIILPNGLNIERFEALHQIQNLHMDFKEKINEFVIGHFFQNYSFDLDKTLYFFISGRFEFHNKGFNLTLEALSRLNWKMKYEEIDKTVVAFIITKQPFYSFNPQVLQAKAQIEEIKRNCKEIEKQLGKNLYNYIVSHNDNYEFPYLNDLIEDYLKLKLRRNVLCWKNKDLPPISTHNLIDEHMNIVLTFIKKVNLVNNIKDKVKIVYHPDFIAQSDPLFRMDYLQFIRGCHLALCPSYYEPWGYTPLESLANAIPSVSSDLTGFGEYASRTVRKPDKNGIYIVKRQNCSFEKSAEQLVAAMFDFVKLTRRDRIDLRNKCEATSLHFDWKKLIRHYEKAYSKVLNKD